MRIRKYMKNMLLLIFVMCMLSLGIAAKNVDVYICGEKIEYDEQSGKPYIDENNRTLVPLRLTMERFGAEVIWDSENKTVLVIKNEVAVRCVIGEKCVYRNNVMIENDAPAVIKDGRTYLPIRVVLECFDANILWDGSVHITGVDDIEYIYNIENTPSITNDYWNVWNEALRLKENGDYNGAVEKMKSIANVFLSVNSSSSNAMFFKHLGECHASRDEYLLASYCFKREAYYWDLADGMEQSRIDAERRAKLIRPYAQIYAVTEGYDFGAKTNFGMYYEPDNGICLGAYAEGDREIYDPYYPNPFYMDSYPELIGKDVAGYILYLPYGTDLSHYNSHYKHAIEKDKIIQIALEPHDGLYEVTENDEYLTKLAKDMEKSECKFMLRFACEMNDTTSKWYEKNPETYIRKFRIMAKIFHKYAPSVPIIWSPNFYPADTMDDYYPGDEYVDYVGISSYQGHQPVTDPLNEGVDRSEWSNQLDRIYSLYGYKKPIIISEGGVSYEDPETGKDITHYAVRQMKGFYTFLPIKYPNVKMFYMFASDSAKKKYCLSGNWVYCNAYEDILDENDCYLSNHEEYVDLPTYYELGNNATVISSEVKSICAYTFTPCDSVAYVVYYINGERIDVSYSDIMELKIDFSEYKGETIELTLKGFAGSHTVQVEKTVKIKVV